jgi:hypothetical protein
MSVRRLIARLHASPWQGAVVVTGGGSLVLSDLLQVPGASATVLRAEVPYSAAALAQMLGASPDQAAASATASDIATVAFQQARDLANAGRDRRAVASLFGLAITASLRTRDPKRGAHRAFVALQTLSASRCWTLELAKGARTRLQEERLVRDVALRALADGFGLDTGFELSLTAADRLSASEMHAPRPWQDLLLGRTPAVAMGAAARPRLLYPGAFNPLHDGHRALADHARRRLGADVAFELCAANVDKPRLNYLALQQRLAQFVPGTTVWLTNLPTFREKARYFPGVTFLVGADTIARIAELRYYERDMLRFRQAMHEIGDLGCRFLVFGRRLGERFVTLRDLKPPAVLARLCDEVPEAEFRIDVSSTALRRGGTTLPQRSTS